MTDFRAIIDDPYRFALGRCLRLEAIDDRAAEMDGLAFGSLAHRVLEALGRDDAIHSDDADAVNAALQRLLDAEARRTFGDHPHPAVVIQIEQMRERLACFARWQAARVAAGWRTVGVELGFGGRRAEQPAGRLVVDGRPIALHGKIDRVDHHAAEDRWAVLDYKTTDALKTPRQQHGPLKSGPRAGQWTDLQLPLYRELLRAWVDESGRRVLDDAAIDAADLGYLRLPRDTADFDTEALGDWSDDDLAAAREAAEQCVRVVRAGVFEFDPERGGGWFDEFALIVGATLFAEADDEQAADEGGES